MDKQPVAYDEDKGQWHAVPVCPDCKETMVKEWIHILGQGERAVWVCECSGLEHIRV